MREFWVSSGHHLSQRLANGELAVTDGLLLAYLARPELLPPPEACAAERALHRALLADPRRPVAPAEIAALADPDGRENWQVMLAFRDRLLAAPSVETAYRGLVAGDVGALPPMFLDQLVHAILRNALDGCQDPYCLRAGELFFRPQVATLHEGRLLLADAEVIEAATPAGGSPLLAMFGREPSPDLDILDDSNAWTYWSRSDAFTMALNLASNPKSREGLARAIEAWIGHLAGLRVRVSPLATLDDTDWRWFIGLDAEATRIGNALWRGGVVERAALERVVALFRLDVPDPARLTSRVAGHPIYLILAMTAERRVRLKPQNLVAGLPWANGASISDMRPMPRSAPAGDGILAEVGPT